MSPRRLAWGPLLEEAKEIKQLPPRAFFAIRRPDLLWRKALGRDLIEIHLEEVAPYLTDSPAILQAGAFDGTETLKLAQFWPKSKIYSFEPVPQLLAQLETRTKDLSQVRRYSVALSDHSGSAQLRVSGNQNEKISSSNQRGASSLLLPYELFAIGSPKFSFSESPPIVVQTMTVADWVRNEGVDRIDFMWLELQGVELPVLKAAGPVLATTRAISMLVCRRELFAGCDLYKEVISWMRSQGFRPVIDRVARWYGNILFVRK